MAASVYDNHSPASSDAIAKIFLGNCMQNDFCPVKDVLAKYGNKWSTYTILYLGQHKQMRFTALKYAIKGISQRMLTVTLRSLEDDGIVVRKIFPQVPPRVEYELTPLGESLSCQMTELARWANDHLHLFLLARKKNKKSLITPMSGKGKS